jgi:rhomboid protease GluP
MSSREEIAPILLPHAESISERSGSTLAWTAATFVGGQFVWLLFVLGLRVHPAYVRPWRAGERPDNRGLLRSLALLIPQKGFWATPTLFNLNLLVWLAMAAVGLGIDGTTATDLIAWGGAFAPLVREGEL